MDIEIEDASGKEGGRRLVLSLKPGQDGTLAWLDRVQHDVEGALRAFRYLAEKAEGSYDPNDARGQRVLQSIAKHLATLETLKRDLLDKIFAREDARGR